MLHTKRLTLVPMDTTFGTQEYVNWMNDPEVIAYLESGGDYTLEKLKAYLSYIEKEPVLFWAIKITASGKHIGNIKIDPADGIGDYGMMIGDKKEWGKGYAEEASQEVINYCFAAMNIHKITLGVIEDNIAAVKLYEKMGFVADRVNTYEGKHKDKYSRVVRMGLLKKSV